MWCRFRARVASRNCATFDLLPDSASIRSSASCTTQVTRANPHQVWCVEVNGPSHYLIGAEREAGDSRVGATRLKMHHLTLLGYTVVMVPYWEWDKIDYRCHCRTAFFFPPFFDAFSSFTRPHPFYRLYF